MKRGLRYLARPGLLGCADLRRRRLCAQGGACASHGDCGDHDSHCKHHNSDLGYVSHLVLLLSSVWFMTYRKPTSSAPLNEPDHYGNSNYQQEVNEPSHRITAQHAKLPTELSVPLRLSTTFGPPS